MFTQLIRQMLFCGVYPLTMERDLIRFPMLVTMPDFVRFRLWVISDHAEAATPTKWMEAKKAIRHAMLFMKIAIHQI